MQRRYGSTFPIMCLGSIHGSNNPLHHSRGRATGLPTMTPALLRGMRTSAARPEWYTEHRTQDPPQFSPLRWWRVDDERLHPSVGLVLRSLGLRATGTSPPTPPMMTDAEQIVMNEITQHEAAPAVIVSNSYRAVKSVQFSKDIRTFMVRAVEKDNTSKVGLTVDKVLDVLSLGEDWVAFFTFAERNLIFGVAALGEGVLTLPEGIKTLGTVELLKHIKSTTKVKYRIYSAAEGLDTLANNDCAADRYNVLVKFVVDAVQHFVNRSVALYDAHSILGSPLFRGKKVRVARHNDITPIYITALKGDWTFLLGRHVDALERPLEWSGNEGNDSTVFFDLNDPDLWSSNPKEVVLIGGESGSGKTWKMMTNNSRDSHLVVYLRLTSRDYKTVTLNDRILHSGEKELKSGKPTFSDDEKERAREARSVAFLNLVKACVEVTIEAACPELLRMLQGKAGISSNEGDPFEVRLCFDEMGSAPELIRACCAMGCDNLHEALEWEKWVRIRMFATGTGVGTVVNPGGSENTFYKLATLAASQPDTNASQSDPNATRMYWKFRLALPFTEDVLALKTIVEELSGKWSDANQRSMVMLQRDSFLKEHKHKILMKEAKEVLVREALFSAVEADTVCRFVLTNARLATLVVARCNALATEIMENTLCAWPSGIDVRREVLERVAKRFKELNSLSQTTPEEACVILVESLRYAIFDNYTNSNPNFSVKTLTTARGVLVDNAIFLTTVGEEYEPVKNLKGDKIIVKRPVLPEEMADGSDAAQQTTSYTACYRKDLGRFSISPAMVVVLLALMLNAFGEKFNDIGDVFEHAVARFVFFAVQVFQGRHIKELVDFITGHFAVVGKTAQKILDSPNVLYDLPKNDVHTNHNNNEEATTTVLGPSAHHSSGWVLNKVVFPSLTLRKSGSLHLDSLANAIHKQKTVTQGPQATLSKRQLKKQCNREIKAKAFGDPCKDALRQFEKLWENTGGAWIEISSRELASADIVLHIPKIVTLSIQCKDRAGTFEAEDISDALSSMLCSDKRPVDAKLEPQNLATRDSLTQKLVDLGAPVIPVMYVSHASTLTDSTSMCSAKFDVIDPHCIMAEGIGEPGIPKDKLIPYLARDNEKMKDDDWRTEVRLHRIRRLMMLFDFRPTMPVDVDVVAIAPQGLTTEEPVKGHYKQNNYYAMTKSLDCSLDADRKVKALDRSNVEQQERDAIKKREEDDAKIHQSRINLLHQFRSSGDGSDEILGRMDGVLLRQEQDIILEKMK